MSANLALFRGLRLILGLGQLLLGLLVLVSALRFVARPDPLDLLRQGDGLFAQGRYHDAYQIYIALTNRVPDSAQALARRGIVEAMRGNTNDASQWLARAIGLHLT